LFTALFVWLWCGFVWHLFLFRLLDEVLFPSYRKVAIKKPLFIIANPRSGTTFLHRLLSLDSNRFTSPFLYHTIFPSVTLFKIIDVLGAVDQKIGRPLFKFFNWLDGIFFKGWEQIHPMGFNQTEEDEGIFIFTLITPAIHMLCPYNKGLEYLVLADAMPEKSRRKWMAFYKNTLQRIVYITGRQKVFLSKNVLNTGRFKSFLEIFPDARIVYLVRHPYNAIPSFCSMFSAAWKAHSPEISDSNVLTQNWGEMAIKFYNYFDAFLEKLPKEQHITIAFDDLRADPLKVIEEIYEHFNINMDEAFVSRLKFATQNQNKYQSKHSYTLEQYGFTKEEVQAKLPVIFEKYGFEK